MTTDSRRNVVITYGTPGVGKTTTAEKLRDSLPNTIMLHSGRVLNEGMGGVPRSEYRNYSSEYKSAKKGERFVQLFEAHRDKQLIIVTDHLIRDVKTPEGINWETTWSPIILPYLRTAYFLYADPQTILQRRQEDIMEGKRMRDTDIATIALEQQLELTEFGRLVRPYVQTRVITTDGRPIEEIVREIQRDIGENLFFPDEHRFGRGKESL